MVTVCSKTMTRKVISFRGKKGDTITYRTGWHQPVTPLLRLKIFPWNFANLLPIYIHTYLPILVYFSKMALIFLRVLIVFIVSSFTESNCCDFIANTEWLPIHQTSIHWIIRFEGKLKSYHMLQPKRKIVSSWRCTSVDLVCLNRRKPFTTLWKTTASDCRHVSASGGYFTHITW